MVVLEVEERVAWMGDGREEEWADWEIVGGLRWEY